MIEELNTLSDLALKILFFYSLTKSVFQYSEGLVQINWAPKEVWKVQMGSEAEVIIVLGGLR